MVARCVLNKKPKALNNNMFVLINEDTFTQAYILYYGSLFKTNHSSHNNLLFTFKQAGRNLL